MTTVTGVGQDSRRRATRRNRLAGAAIFGVTAALTLLGVVIAAVESRQRESPYLEAQQGLDDALRKVPFDVRLPETLPMGKRLVRTYLKEPDVDEGTVFQMSTWYIRPGVDTMAIQVWQTNEGYLKRRALDPTQRPGREVVVDERSWWRLDGAGQSREVGVSYSRREDDGVTVVVSGPNDREVADMIGRLHRVAPIDPDQG